MMAAILSDVADEQRHFHKPSWRSGLNSAKYVIGEERGGKGKG